MAAEALVKAIRGRRWIIIYVLNITETKNKSVIRIVSNYIITSTKEK
jgi:hypothetical protein